MAEAKPGDNTADDTNNSQAELIRELEKEIELSQDKTRLILAAIPVGLILVQHDGMIDVVNRVIQDMFGYSRNQLFEQPITLLIPDLPLDSKSATTERWARRADGEQFPVQISSVKVPTPDGERIFVFVNDITERHKLEKLKQDFIAMISHDLRAPLMNISGIIELATAGKFGDLSNDGMEQLQTADSSLTRVIQMVSELLEIEKMEDGHMVLDLRVCNLTMVANSAISDLQRLALDKNVQISSWEPNLFANCDSERIHRVLVNLISNAIKFSPASGTISLENKIAGGYLEIRVIDQGRGVPEKFRESIFSKYEQVDRTDASERGGTGLGLAVCKTIIEAHGGKIGVRPSDTANGGSVFWFQIPYTDD